MTAYSKINPFFEKAIATEIKVNVPDLAVWQSFKSGNEGAFIEIYKKYINLLFSQGSQICPDQELVKDSLQDFFIELRSRREFLSDTDNIKLYLLKSFRRKLIKDIKNSKRFSNDKISEILYPIELSFDEKMINAQMEQEQFTKLNDALQKLPIKYRETLYYYFYQDLGYNELMQLFKFTHISSARRLVYKSLKKLKGIFIA